MKKISLFLSLYFVFSISLWGQSPAKYWVQFADKKHSSYTISKPEEFLSPRAIDKRERFNIPITEQDLPVSDFYIKEVRKLDTTIVVLTKSKWLNGITIYSEDSLICHKISNLPFVVQCEKTITLTEKEEFSDMTFTYSNRGEVKNRVEAYNLDYGKGKGQIKLNNIQWLHRMGFLGQEMLIMVMDAGFHNSDSIKYLAKLKEENRLLGARNFVEMDVNPFRQKGSHGTMVLSCISSYIPGELVGTAPFASIYLAKTEDERTEHKIEEDNWVAGIEWADSLGVDVLNSSLGYSKFDDTLQKRTYEDLTGKVSRASIAATIAAQKGIIVCVSAGNEGNKEWHHISCPADAEDILAVGAVATTGVRAPFSSYGPTADGRIKPDAAATGYFTQVASPSGKQTLSNGTSFASPLLAGMSACLWQAFPEKSNFQIMDAIRTSGDRAQNPDESLGYGVTDFLKAFNFLKYDEKNQQNSQNVNFVPDIQKYHQEEKNLSFEIFSEIKQKISVQLFFQNSNLKISKQIKLKPGINHIEIKIPKSVQDFDLIDLNIEKQKSIIYQYLLGFERIP